MSIHTMIGKYSTTATEQDHLPPETCFLSTVPDDHRIALRGDEKTNTPSITITLGEIRRRYAPGPTTGPGGEMGRGAEQRGDPGAAPLPPRYDAPILVMRWAPMMGRGPEAPRRVAVHSQHYALQYAKDHAARLLRDSKGKPVAYWIARRGTRTHDTTQRTRR